MEPCWALLPWNVLDTILEKVEIFSDYLRFSVVCKSWFCVAKEQVGHRRNTFNNEPPLLLVPSQDTNKEHLCIYNINKKKLVDFKLHIPYHQRCCGSSHGWLSFVRKDWSVFLFNPFTKSQINLPSIFKIKYGYHDTKNDPLYEYKVVKVILSANPSISPNNYTVVALNMIEGPRTLSYIKPGHKCWKKIGYKGAQWGPWEWGFPISDVIYHNGLIYAVGFQSELARVYINDNDDNDSPELEMVLRYRFIKVRQHNISWYIVESSKKDLLIILRYMEEKDCDFSYLTSTFRVFKLLERENKPFKVMKMADLEGDAVFIGDSQSIAVSALDFSGCQPNSIYYTDDYILFEPYVPFGPRDIGVFNLQSLRFNQHYKPKIGPVELPQPIWILPTC